MELNWVMFLQPAANCQLITVTPPDGQHSADWEGIHGCGELIHRPILWKNKSGHVVDCCVGYRWRLASLRTLGEGGGRGWSFSSLWSRVTWGGFTRAAQMAGWNLHLHPAPTPSLLLVLAPATPMCFVSYPRMLSLAMSQWCILGWSKLAKCEVAFWRRQQWRYQVRIGKGKTSTAVSTRFSVWMKANIHLNKTLVFQTRTPVFVPSLLNHTPAVSLCRLFAHKTKKIVIQIFFKLTL